MTLGETLKQVRTAAGLNMEVAAEILGFKGPAKITRIEKGYQSISLDQFLDYSSKLGAGSKVTLEVKISGITITNEIL